MGTWSSTEPTTVGTWSEETYGGEIERFKSGSYGYYYRSCCAITRLNDNRICARIKIYISARANWSWSNEVRLYPWVYDVTMNVGSSNGGPYYYDSTDSHLARATGKGDTTSTFYYTFDSDYAGTTVIVGVSHDTTTQNSSVTLDTPAARNPEKIGEDRALLDTGMYYILDSNFVPLACFERYSSFIWTDRYDEVGDFEIETTPDPEILELLKVDNYILNTKSEHEMIIEKLVITTDIDDGPKLTVSGSSLESILKRRIVWNTTNISGNMQQGIKQLVTENIISPTDEDRKIPNFVFQETSDTAITTLELTGEYDKSNTIYDILEDVCEANDIGFKVTRNTENQFVLTLYAGKDHSYDQTQNNFVLFSPGFDNLRNSEYTKDAIDSVNTMFVAGESDSDYLLLGSYTGLARREGYFSAGSMTDGYSGTMQDYLKEKGMEEMKDKQMEEKFEGEADVSGLFKLNADFGLGDIVEFENEYSMRGKVRVTEIIYSEDDSGHVVYPTFEAYVSYEEEESTTT